MNANHDNLDTFICLKRLRCEKHERLYRHEYQNLPAKKYLDTPTRLLLLGVGFGFTPVHAFQKQGIGEVCKMPQSGNTGNVTNHSAYLAIELR